MAVTRNTVSFMTFGAPRKLPTNTQPTYTDLMKKYIQLRQDLMTDNGKYPSFLDISHKMCYEVEEIWERASLPIVTHAQAIENLKSFHDKYKTILKVHKREKDQPNYQRRLSGFRDSGNSLFDLSKCKCFDMVSDCKCAKEFKVPAKERYFLQDQRGARKMIIGGIDQAETSKDQVDSVDSAEDDTCSSVSATGDDYIPDLELVKNTL